MKKVLVVAAIAATALLGGCAMPVMHGAIFTDGIAPVANWSSTDYVVDKGDYTILGPAEGTSEFINVLGLVATGDGGYQSAFAKACQAKGADNLIDAKCDVKIFSVLGIFARVNFKVSGTAVKRK